MRVGPLILQLCALLVAGALIVGGYVIYKERQLDRFQKGLDSNVTNIGSFGGAVSFLAGAPSAYCKQMSSGFDGAESATMYVHNQQIRITFENITDRTVMHQIVNADGFYVWTDTSPGISFVPREKFDDVPYESHEGADAFGSIISSLTCEVWWTPNDDIFDVPANLPMYDAEI